MANDCGARLDRPTIEARLHDAVRREADMQRLPRPDDCGDEAQALRSVCHQVGLYQALLARMGDPSGSDPASKQTRVLVRLAQVIDSLSQRALGLELALGRELQRGRSSRAIDEELRSTYGSLDSLRRRRACVERELGSGEDGTLGATRREAPAR
jgi:hypothetical protein